MTTEVTNEPNEPTNAAPVTGGVWGHSSVSGGENYIIFSSHINLYTVEEILQSEGIGYKRLKGCYKNQTECAWIVNTNQAVENFLVFRSILSNQESVLLLGPTDARDRRPAALLYFRGDLDYLGLFQSVDKATALAQDAWTFDPSTNTYYIALSEDQ